MVFADYFFFENPEILAFVAGLLLFVLLFYVFQKLVRLEKGVALLISIIAGLIAGWKLYVERFYGWEATLIMVIYVMFAVVILKILVGFFRGAKKTFR